MGVKILRIHIVLIIVYYIILILVVFNVSMDIMDVIIIIIINIIINVVRGRTFFVLPLPQPLVGLGLLRETRRGHRWTS